MSDLDPKVAEELDKITDLQALADAVHLADAELKAADAELEQKKKALAYLKEIIGPKVMLSLGQVLSELEDGTRVRLGIRTNARIIAGRDLEAARWLKKQGVGGIGIGLIKMPLAERELESVAEIARRHNAEFGVQIHAASLSASLKELKDEGVEIPRDLIGVFEKAQVTVTKPRWKK